VKVIRPRSTEPLKTESKKIYRIYFFKLVGVFYRIIFRLHDPRVVEWINTDGSLPDGGLRHCSNKHALLEPSREGRDASRVLRCLPSERSCKQQVGRYASVIPSPGLRLPTARLLRRHFYGCDRCGFN
jgi:hypothetical protein